jgi:hypothetical protein
MLSYRTDWMSRDEIVSVTYDVGGALNDVKFEAGLIDAATHAAVCSHFEIARRIFPEIDALKAMAEPQRSEGLRRLAAEVTEANVASLVGVDELRWKSSTGIRVSRVLVRHLAAALPRELAHGLARLRGRYNDAPPVVRRRATCSARPPTSIPAALTPLRIHSRRSRDANGQVLGPLRHSTSTGSFRTDQR